LRSRRSSYKDEETAARPGLGVDRCREDAQLEDLAVGRTALDLDTRKRLAAEDPLVQLVRSGLLARRDDRVALADGLFLAPAEEGLGGAVPGP